MTIVIILILLTAFAFWEIILLVAIAVLPWRKAMRVAQYYEDKSIQSIFATLSFYGGFRLKVENRLNEALPRRFIVVSNHQSLLDIVVIMRTLPSWAKARFVAKQELGYGIPLISLILRVSGHSLVRRKGDALEAMRKVTRMAKRCRREGSIPVIFPEGTRSRTGALGRFHSAGYRKILEVEPVPILVAAMEGGWKIANIRDFLFKFRNIPFTASYLALLPAPHSKKEALETLEKARKIIEDSLEEQRKV
ncbi:MAG: lysophospholipid acyltransferase family protein [Spirochaetia bacterium]|nr:lysophospholipid acyltransferase family protein [Spirochaetia bacterium]